MVITNFVVGQNTLLNFRNFGSFKFGQIRNTHTSPQRKTYYETLNLERNCSNQDIKDAFIKLSKEYHPDVNKSDGAHSHYTKIVEAYNVLGKPQTRRLYDLQLSAPLHYGVYKENIVHKEEFYPNSVRDSSFWEYRDKTQDKYYKGKPYYGIKGVPRLSNMFIGSICILFATMGVALQFYLIRKSMTLKREILLKQSAEAERILAEVKHLAEVNGNKKQIEILKEKVRQQQMGDLK